MLSDLEAGTASSERRADRSLPLGLDGDEEGQGDAREITDETFVPPGFSIFTKSEKKLISAMASFGAMFSTLSSYIYFPALEPMSTDLGVSSISPSPHTSSSPA